MDSQITVTKPLLKCLTMIGLLMAFSGAADMDVAYNIKAEIDKNGKTLKVDRWWWSESEVAWKGTDANSVYLVKKESVSLITAITGSNMPEKILNTMMKCEELASLVLGAVSEEARSEITAALSRGVKIGNAVTTINGVVFTVKVQEVGDSAFMSCVAHPKGIQQVESK